MATRHNQATITTTAAVLEGTQYPGWILQNLGAATVFLGDSTVTAGAGFPVVSGGVFSPPEIGHKSLSGKADERLYGRTASGTADVRILVPGRISVA